MAKTCEKDMGVDGQGNGRWGGRRWVTHTVGWLAALLFITASAAIQAMDVDDYLKISGPAPTQTLHYGAGASQFVEYFRPEGRGPFPIAILMHGGCWRSRFGGIAQFR